MLAIIEDCAYLEPIGDFDIELGDTLDPVVEDLNSLRWLEVCL